MTSVSLGSFAITTYEDIRFKADTGNILFPQYNDTNISFNKVGFYIITLDNGINTDEPNLWCITVMCIVYIHSDKLYCKSLGRYNCNKNIYICNADDLPSRINLDVSTNVLQASNFVIAVDYITTPPDVKDLGTVRYYTDVNMLITYHG